MDAGYAIRGSNRRIRWSRVVAWMPLIFLGLMVIELMLEPGQEFYGGHAETLALVFQYGTDIYSGLALGMIATATVSLLILIWQWLGPIKLEGRDFLAEALNAGFLLVFFVMTSLFACNLIPAIHHRATETTADHTYYLETLHCFSGIANCPLDDFYKQRFVIVDCESGALTCKNMFISKSIGWTIGDPKPTRPYPEPYLKRTPTNYIQLIYEDRILWEGS